MKKIMKKAVAVAAVASLPLVLAGCAPEAAPEAKGTISYGLWDSNQLPAYQQCADDFTAANPDITIEIEQIGWDDYWKKVNAGFVSGDGYDVFTSHLAFYPEFVANGTILALDEYIARDGVDVDNTYQPGLASLWTSPEGVQYGLPKDFDTIALFYNKQLTDAAGVDMSNLDWNPTDGGTYEKAIAHLTVDENGVRGDEAGFDKSKVKTYGIWMEGSGGGDGQTQWSFLAAANGWKVNDGPWDTNYHYDDAKLHETIDWWYSLVEKGYMPSFDQQQGVGWSDQLAAGTVAMASNGSWMTGSIFGAKSDTFEPALAATPVGPTGSRASMYNGLADNISATTENPEAAWQWVKYLGSAACQDVVAEAAVVFPAIPSATDKAVAAMQAKGVDVSAFSTHIDNGTTFLFPIADKKSKINDIMTPAMEAIMSGKAKADSLTAANDQVKALFQ
ncbi:ABC transporter substrate-binding protein [Rhodoluna limnophila]|uniref:ABC transporter substrate-binding protein n=1 Tax=Rhodoluna limnophila TaxID=232537 RepID=UPI001105F7B5|nr:sugar ABC transporter substrate-binding protein [Rhodoluna limnophila]